MHRLISFSILSSALLASQVANANLPNGTLSGNAFVNISTGPIICQMDVYISNNTASASFTPNPSPLCNSMFLAMGTATMNGNNITFSNVYLQTSYGNCTGSLQGTWNGTNLYVSGSLFGSAGSCSFTGVAR